MARLGSAPEEPVATVASTSLIAAATPQVDTADAPAQAAQLGSSSAGAAISVQCQGVAAGQSPSTGSLAQDATASRLGTADMRQSRSAARIAQTAPLASARLAAFQPLQTERRDVDTASEDGSDDEVNYLHQMRLGAPTKPLLPLHRSVCLFVETVGWNYIPSPSIQMGYISTLPVRMLLATLLHN